MVSCHVGLRLGGILRHTWITAKHFVITANNDVNGAPHMRNGLFPLSAGTWPTQVTMVAWQVPVCRCRASSRPCWQGSDGPWCWAARELLGHQPRTCAPLQIITTAHRMLTKYYPTHARGSWIKIRNSCCLSVVQVLVGHNDNTMIMGGA